MSKFVTIDYLKFELVETGSSKEAYVVSFDHRKKFGKVRIPKSIVVDGEIINVVGFRYHCLDGMGTSRLEVPNTIKINGADLTEYTGTTEHINGATLYIYEARDGYKSPQKTKRTKSSSKIVQWVKALVELLSNLFVKKSCVLFYKTSNKKMLRIKQNAFDAPISSHTYKKGEGKIVFKQNISKIEKNAFEECEKLTSMIIPEGVKDIGDQAFYKCEKLESITIPSSVTKIGEQVFAFCYDLQKINITNISAFCKIEIGILGGVFTYCKPYLYLYGELITDITLPSEISEINGLFSNYKKLNSITLPNNITKMRGGLMENVFIGCDGLQAFYGKFASADNRCLIIDGELRSFAPAGLTKYQIPTETTTIRENVFWHCTDLQSIKIPSSVENIRSGAFSHCKALSNVYCEAAIPPRLSNSNAFEDNADGRKIYVPRASVEAYKTADKWKEYASSIEPFDF